MCWCSYNFSQDLWHTTNGLHKKFPIKTCGMSDDLSGDMLAPSWPNLVYLYNAEVLQKYGSFHWNYLVQEKKMLLEQD